MIIHPPTLVHHRIPSWFELVVAALIGAAVLFGALLLAGHSDLLPWTSTSNTVSTVERFPGKAADDTSLFAPSTFVTFPGKDADDLGK